MSAPKPIIIAGGGLAGLALGLLLRGKGIPVTIFESGDYPRHRVCGEFISGRGVQILERLIPPSGLDALGARRARTALFASARVHSGVRALPATALCLSRFTLDAALARIFTENGGELRARERWMEGFEREGVVRATGRRLALATGGPRLLGLKAHAFEVRLESDLEIHLVPEGYVGLCRLSDGRVNVCGLFRRVSTAPELASGWEEFLRGPEGSSLRKRLKGARFDKESFRGVAGLDLQPRQAAAGDEWSLGDSLTMIPPVTGNGMSMAMESAVMAAEELGRYSLGSATWKAARQAAAARCDAAFGGRLRWARWLHHGLLGGRFAELALLAASRVPGLWGVAFGRTR